MKIVSTATLAFALCFGLLSGANAEDAKRDHSDHKPGQGPMHHPEMQGAQARFHDLMEPLWHSPPGKERTARACGQAKEIATRIQAMASEKGPVKVLGQMAETSKRLAPACSQGGQAGKVDQLLDALHEQFHELMGMR